MKFNIEKFALVLCLFSLSSLSQAGTLLGLDEALKLAFPQAIHFEAQSLTLSSQEADTLQGQIQGKVYAKAVQAYAAQGPAGTLGLAFLDEELGKHQPMALLISLDGQRRLKRIDLLVYREHYGGGVAARRFMGQFEGKGLEHALKIGEDLDAVSGATISSKAVALGARKALRLAEKFETRGKK